MDPGYAGTSTGRQSASGALPGVAIGPDGPVTLAEMGPLLDHEEVAAADMEGPEEPPRGARNQPPPMAVAVPIILFVVFEIWFLVPLPKGPFEAWLGY